MKKIFLTTAALLAGIFLSAHAGSPGNKMEKETRKQIRKEKKELRRALWLHSVNVITAGQFYIDFPGAKDTRWTEAAFAEATFDDQGTLRTAYYDKDNELVGTTTDVEFSVLPEKAKQYIDKKYADYTAERVILFDDNEVNETDMSLYSSPFEDKDTYFAVLTNGSKKIILKVMMDGSVFFFRNYK